MRTHFSGPVNSANGFETGSILAADGTAAITIANTTGAVTITNLTSTNDVFTNLTATNVAVTNLQALDGTAAGSVANSTGVVTITAIVGTTTTAPTLKTTTIQAADATAAATIANSTGIITVASGLTFADAKNIVVNASTGTKIGTATSQKIGFWNVAPVIQPATTGTVTGYTSVGGSAVLSQSTFTGNTGTAAYTIGDIVLALKQAGIMTA